MHPIVCHSVQRAKEQSLIRLQLGPLDIDHSVEIGHGLLESSSRDPLDELSLENDINKHNRYERNGSTSHE